MDTQDSWGSVLNPRARLAGGETVHPGRGRLEVIDGVVWLTRRGDPRDHLLSRGEAIEIRGHDDVLFEPWGQVPAVIEWRPLDRHGRWQRGAADLGAAALRFVAARCREAAAGLMHAADRLARLAAATPHGTTGRSCSA